MKVILEYIRIHEVLLGWLVVFSLIISIMTVTIIPLFIIRIPSDYFLYTKPHSMLGDNWHPVFRMMLRVGKNILGLILFCIGLLLLVLPGQGILTILVGLLLINFPGKYRLERWLVEKPKIYHAIDWLRQRAGRAPLEL